MSCVPQSKLELPDLFSLMEATSNEGFAFSIAAACARDDAGIAINAIKSAAAAISNLFMSTQSGVGCST